MIEHGGDVPGYHTQVARFPADSLGMISMSNDENGVHLMEVAKWRVADDVRITVLHDYRLI